MQANRADNAKATLLTPSLAETALVATAPVLDESDALCLVTDNADAAVAVDEDSEADLVDSTAAEEADAVPVAPTVLLETTSSPGTEAIGWRLSSAPQLLAVFQPFVYSSSHQEDWVTR